ncbi:hypothetical protein AVEN_115717-1 [Araneus ventricosus]|uniref:Uncharacterized protein n=1 Tax=Araneus ventricosus TaxID=182803 RepID=A0A4Y2UV32_ARAVE|nr:hypothetical protein AVEN_115717-1 [Araneus ventricosus]
MVKSECVLILGRKQHGKQISLPVYRETEKQRQKVKENHLRRRHKFENEEREKHKPLTPNLPKFSQYPNGFGDCLNRRVARKQKWILGAEVLLTQNKQNRKLFHTYTIRRLLRLTS